MSMNPAGCPASLTLNDSEIAYLAALEGAFAIDPVAWCEIQPGHDGPHYAIAQGAGADDNETTWWHIWKGESRSITVIERCHELEDRTGGNLWCRLPRGHEGPHTECSDTM